MPCYTVNLVSVEFKAENLDLLALAAKAEGLSFSIHGTTVNMGGMVFNTTTNKITARESVGLQDRINSLKRAYSREVVKRAAKQNRWTLRETKTNQYVASKY